MSTRTTLTHTMPIGQKKCISRRRLLLQEHPHRIHPKRTAVATWNLRGIGRDGWAQNSWLKVRMVLRMAKTRRWRALLITDCCANEPGTIKIRGLGGHWLLVFGCRSGVFLDPGLARCWERGGSIRYDSPGGRSCGVLVPCAGRGVKGRALALFFYYAPVSGAGFDNERRTSLNELSAMLVSFPVRSVLILGGDFNAEVGYRGARKTVWDRLPMAVGTAAGTKWWSGLKVSP